ncbi:hypothetical protein H4R18_001844 [Coemansia javaensis]|uniref:SH3 domain-containing protein n=1 Tax=Coemansia javaensis TaxID=2761396 RepID=A0A9W8HBH6_9FUNG|nr:hypothetical protein H4R18_001844 [Coemansia javaensis]
MTGFDIKSRLPIPMGLETECKKGARIIESFLKPGAFGTDRLIPPTILEKARGIAFLSVIKGGFIWSGRIGSGLIVARLPNGNWSAPSAIAIGGAGVGGQIGGELTDFVMVLTTPAAVRAFSHGGNLTLGANVGVAAGPFGRSGEVSGAVRDLAPVLSYSRTKGLFIGVSLEGTVLIERKDANKNAYGRAVRPQELLEGLVPPPPIADCLYRALNMRIPRVTTDLNTPPAAGSDAGPYGPTSFYGDSAYGSAANHPAAAPGSAPPPIATTTSYLNRSVAETSHQSSPGYGAGFGGYPPAASAAAPAYEEVAGGGARPNTDYYSAPTGDVKTAPSTRRPPPPPPPPAQQQQQQPASLCVTAGYDFRGDQEGDLSFSKGDLITILDDRSTLTTLDAWWTGRCNGREGKFPANYLDEQSKKALGLA